MSWFIAYLIGMVAAPVMWIRHKIGHTIPWNYPACDWCRSDIESRESKDA